MLRKGDIFHDPTIPGTHLKRIAVSKPFIDEVFDEVSAWDGWRFRAGKYGMQPFTLDFRGDADELDVRLAKELGRMCTTLGPSMDRVLKDVLDL